MISKHNVEIEIDWLKGCNYAVMPRRLPGTSQEDVRTENWWSDDNYILIERPKPDPKFVVHAMDQRFWAVVKTGRPVGEWVALFDSELDPDAMSNAYEFADKRNREAME